LLKLGIDRTTIFLNTLTNFDLIWKQILKLFNILFYPKTYFSAFLVACTKLNE
jgi:hypothetical protein